jgi:spore maturation protein CgeB
MKIVIFGLTISSTWGNGHATLWRGLCSALIRRGHRVVFVEHDVPYYADNRDLNELPGGALILYRDWSDAVGEAERQLADADAGLVTSYCPHGVAATGVLLSSRVACKAFYDLDTPITLARLGSGQTTPWIGPRGLRDFDLVLSFTGGRAPEELRARLGARRVVPLYGSVDPDLHRPGEPVVHYRADLSYLGTYASDRQAALEALFVDPARRLPAKRFAIAGAQYPDDFPWCANIFFVRHLPAAEHPAFFSSSRLTLNVTREPMASMGYCPSGRLFEAAACGCPILSDAWQGIEAFYEPGREILIARSTDDALAAMEADEAELRRIAAAARERTRHEHTADHRAVELEQALTATPDGRARSAAPLAEV